MVTLRAKRSRKNGPFYQSGHKNEGWTPVFPSPGHMYCTGVSVWTDVSVYTVYNERTRTEVRDETTDGGTGEVTTVLGSDEDIEGSL